MTVVTAGELNDLGPTGTAARQPDRRHRRLGPRIDQADLLDRGAADDLGGQLDLTRRRRTEARTTSGRASDGRDDLGVRVSMDQRTPGANQVDIPAAVRVV